MKLSEKLTAAAVMTFITAVSVMTIFGKNTSENFPGINKDSLFDGTYIDEVIAYTADGFAGRDIWRSVGAEISARVGEPIVNDVYITDERLLSVYIPSTDGMLSVAAAVNRFSANYSGAVYFAAIPTSAGVYGDVMPSYLRSVTEKQQADLLYETLSADIRKIDAYMILKMLSDNYIYYRTDSKWTSYGAYCVYRTVIQKLGFMPVSYDKYTIQHITDNYRGDLYELTNYMESKPDLLDIYKYDDGIEVTECIAYDSGGISHNISLYDTEAADSEEQYDLYLGSSVPLIKIKTSVNNDRRLLVIGDMYADCFIPFLTKHYSEIAFVSADQTDKEIRKYIDPEEYEQTLFLFGIDSLSGNVLDGLI